ncbi:MAG: FecR domain-containing protein [Verrucomicrobiota bacterium]
MDSHLKELMVAAQEGSLSPEEFSVLEERLRESKSDREQYLRFQQLQTLLESSPPLMEEMGLHDREERRTTIDFFRVAIPFAVAAMVTVLGIFFLRANQVGTDVDAGESIQVATLLLEEGCRWNSRRFMEGERLSPGAIDLDSGTAVIRFDGGAELIMTGPGRVDLLTPMSASLLGGEVVIRAEEGAEGFQLSTPSGDLIDLGTEFAVKIDEQGHTELHVHEGEVAIGASLEPSSIVREGNAVRLPSEGGAELSELPLNAPRFSELMARAAPKERRDLMIAYEGFHEEAGEYKPYQLNSGKGWAGPWRLRREGESGNTPKDSSREMTIAYSQMDVAWPIKGGQLGMLELPPGTNVRIRRFKNSIQMDRWGHRYLSFLVTETVGDPGSTEDREKGRSDIRLTLRSSRDYFGHSLSVGWERSRLPRVSVGGGPTVRSTRAIPEGETVFCVAKITSRKSGRDEVRFRFYTREEDLDLLEPTAWDVTLTNLELDRRFDLLLLTSDSHQKRYVDEIRLGPTWRSVTPIYLSQEAEAAELSLR